VDRAGTAAITHTITSITNRDGELLVATTAGVIERVPWRMTADQPTGDDSTGFFDAASAIHLATVVFPQGERIRPNEYIVHMQFCSVLEVLAVTLSDGTAAILSLDADAAASSSSETADGGKAAVGGTGTGTGASGASVVGLFVPPALVDHARRISKSSMESVGD
jgi:hypothetical protein